MSQNIDDVFGELVHSTEGMTHETVAPEQIQPSGLATVTIQGDPFKLSESAAEALRSQLGIPAQFLSRLESPTARLVVGELWRTWIASNSRRSIVVSRHAGTVIALSEARLARLGNEYLVDLMRSEFQRCGMTSPTVRQFTIDPNKNFSLGITFPTIAAEPRVGDITQAGLHIEHCPTGQSPTSVNVYLYRLWCSNGAVTPICLGRKTIRVRRHYDKAPEELLERIQRVTREALRQLPAKVNELNSLAQIQVNPEVELRQIARRGRYNRRITSELLTALQHDEAGTPGDTLYDVFLALSRVATHFDLNDRMRRQLLRFSGIYSQTNHVRRCPYCQSVLSTDPDQN